MELEFNFEKILNATKQSFELNDAMIYRLYNSSVQVSEEVVEDIENALIDSDYEKIKNAAHKLKGASGSIRLDQIYELSTEIENDAKEQKQRDYRSDIETIKKYFSALAKSIKKD